MLVHLPFRFESTGDRYFLTNEIGDYLFLSKAQFQKYLTLDLENNDTLTHDLKSAYFICQDSVLKNVIEELGIKYRTKKKFLLDFTSLHMVVPTLRCNSRCIYCQVSSRAPDASGCSMDRDTADAIVEMIFNSPSPRIKIEFQGGEPLLNFEIVRHIVTRAERLKKNTHKDIQYVVCTNLTLLTPQMVTFFKRHSIYLSISVDGPADLHDRNRPLRNGQGSFERVQANLERARALLGEDKISALMTATKESLPRMTEIVDVYRALGFRSIFLRAINRYGRATAEEDVLQYSGEDFIEAYKKAFRHIIEINRNGEFFLEEYATILLGNILTPFSTGLVDLQSPAGAGIGCVLYNYDGNVYATDEGRMLAEMGDDAFKLGNTCSQDYRQIFDGKRIREIVEEGILEGSHECTFCPYVPYCGHDPVRRYREKKEGKVRTEACKQTKSIMKFLLDLIETGDSDTQDVFWSWLTSRSLREVKVSR